MTHAAIHALIARVRAINPDVDILILCDIVEKWLNLLEDAKPAARAALKDTKP